MYTLDTNGIIYYMKRDEAAIQKLDAIFLETKSIYISAITEIELYSFSGLTAEDARDIANFLNSVSVINIDSHLAQLAGQIRRLYRLKLPDSAVAATALSTNTRLVTRNVRDFKKVPGLEIEKV